jgi:hypothetical protein
VLLCFYRCERRFVKRKRYKIEVPMNFFHFEEVGMPDMKPRIRKEKLANGEVQNVSLEVVNLFV